MSDYSPALADAKRLIDGAASDLQSMEAQIEALETERNGLLAELVLLRPLAQAVDAFLRREPGDNAKSADLIERWGDWHRWMRENGADGGEGDMPAGVRGDAR